jgi:hypothetical protein
MVMGLAGLGSKNDCGVEARSNLLHRLTTHFYVVAMSKMVKLYLHSPIPFCGVVLSQLSTERAAGIVVT